MFELAPTGWQRISQHDVVRQAVPELGSGDQEGSPADCRQFDWWHNKTVRASIYTLIMLWHIYTNHAVTFSAKCNKKVFGIWEAETQPVFGGKMCTSNEATSTLETWQPGWESDKATSTLETWQPGWESDKATSTLETWQPGWESRVSDV